MSRTVQVKALFLISLIAGDCISAAASQPALPLLAAAFAAHSTSAFHHVIDHADIANIMSVDIDPDAEMTATHKEQLGNHSLASSLAQLLQDGETRGKWSGWHNLFHNKKVEAAVEFVDVTSQIADNTNNIVGIVATASTSAGQAIPVLGLVLGTAAVGKGVYDIKKLEQAMKQSKKDKKKWRKTRVQKCQIWNEKKNVFIAVASTATAGTAAVAAFSAPATFGASLAVPAAMAGGALMVVSVGNLIYNKKYSCRKLQANVLQELKALKANTLMMKLEAVRLAKEILMLKEEAADEVFEDPDEMPELLKESQRKAKKATKKAKERQQKAAKQLHDMAVAAQAEGDDLLSSALNVATHENPGGKPSPLRRQKAMAKLQEDTEDIIMKGFAEKMEVAWTDLAKKLEDPDETPSPLRRQKAMAKLEGGTAFNGVYAASMSDIDM